jgi:hypothetical protein
MCNPRVVQNAQNTGVAGWIVKNVENKELGANWKDARRN